MSVIATGTATGKEGASATGTIERQRPRVMASDFSEPVKTMYRESAALSDSWARHYRAFWGLPDEWSP